MELILASKSPRRQALLRAMGFEFEVVLKETDESYPSGMVPAAVAQYIAEKKAMAFEKEAFAGKLLIAADTIVVIENQILGKPAGKKAAAEMLNQLSGKVHEVITGVTLRSQVKTTSFAVITKVCFEQLTAAEIDFYIDHYQPFDKAGAYGIQEWIGYNKIAWIEGSYNNVVGLPTEALYPHISPFLSEEFPV